MFFTNDFVFYCLITERKYNPANWTISTLPTFSRELQLQQQQQQQQLQQQRRLRSTSFEMMNHSFLNDVQKFGGKKYPCYDCGFSFGLRATLMRHKSFECDRRLVNKILKPSEGMKVSSKKRYNCSKCSRSYTIFKSLWRHQHYECGIQPKYECYYCSHKTKYKDSLMKHIMSKHLHNFMPNVPATNN